MENGDSSSRATGPALSRLFAALRDRTGRLLARSERLLAITFASLVTIGTIILSLPISHTSEDFTFLDALFTATSAVCVTGLIVVDTGRDFTPFGQGVILVLFQLGGLGIMTFAAVATQVLGGKLSFRSQAILSDTFYQGNAATLVRRDLKRILALTVSFEALGILLIYGRMGQSASGPPPLFSAIFHSVSAFCNAGFSLHADSMTQFRADPVVMFAIVVLIIVGGLGHTVLLEMARRSYAWIRRRRQSPLVWSLNSRIVLRMSVGLIALGAVMFLILGVSSEEETWPASVGDAVFQSVTCRTAGFNSIDIGSLSTTALLVMVVLMFIGGSPASCAGGVKTTSVATWYAQLWAWLRGQRDVTLLGRRLPPDLVARAAMIIGLAVVWNAVGCLVLTAFEAGNPHMAFEDLVFEQASAFATVGLSTGITASLSVGSKLWIILSMFVGRIGPLTFAMVISTRETERIRYPEERVMVG